MKQLAALLAFTILAAKTQSQTIEDGLRISTSNVRTNARAMGIGISYFGISDEANATSFNPAGLSLLPHHELSGGLGFSNTGSTTTYFGNTNTTSSSSLSLSNFAFAMPFVLGGRIAAYSFSYSRDNDYNSKLQYNGFNTRSSIIRNLAQQSSDTAENLVSIASLGVMRVGQIHTPLDDSLQQSADELQSGAKHNFSFGLGICLSESFSLGLCLGVLSGRINYNRNFSEEDLLNIYSVNDPLFNTIDFRKATVHDTLIQEFSAVTLKVGALLKLGEWGRLSFAFSPPTAHEVTENYSRRLDAVFDDGGSSYAGFHSENRYTVQTPTVLSLGISAHKSGFIVAGAMEYRDMSNMDFGGSSSHFNDLNRAISFDLSQQIAAGVGAEYTFQDLPLSLRAAMSYTSSNYSSAALSDAYSMYSAGFGIFVLDNLRLDLAAQYQRNGGNFAVYGDGTDASYNLKNSIFQSSLQLSYRFGSVRK